MDHLEAHRTFYANLVTANAGVPRSATRLINAFSSIPRERFLGPGPWRVFTPVGYVATPSNDPAFIYQDVTVALQGDGPINNGQPTLHAICLAALGIELGETVIHVGAGSGYYSAILAELVGPGGSVFAVEIDPELARRSQTNLSDHPQAVVEHRSGVEGRLAPCDAIYVNAGATDPAAPWIEALRLGGRLLFPLTPEQGLGAMLLLTRTTPDAFAARFVCPAMFIPCVGARNDESAARLADAFKAGTFRNVRSMYRNDHPDDTCWFHGQGWWLSTKPLDGGA